MVKLIKNSHVIMTEKATRREHSKMNAQQVQKRKPVKAYVVVSRSLITSNIAPSSDKTIKNLGCFKSFMLDSIGTLN
jgi:hypothetical protein